MVSVRPYSPQYSGQLLDIFNCWDDIQPYTWTTLENNLKEIGENCRYSLFLALDDQNRALGYIFCTPVYSLAFGAFLEVQELLVRPGERSRGIGAMLLKAAEDKARASGFPQIRLSSQLHRLDAHRFYERMGYARYKQSAFFEKNL